MLQIWSDRFFLTTPHRVINSTAQVRYSAPIFFEPNLNTTVSPLELSADLISRMSRPRAPKGTRVVYGEHILALMERSFPAKLQI